MLRKKNTQSYLYLLNFIFMRKQWEQTLIWLSIYLLNQSTKTLFTSSLYFKRVNQDYHLLKKNSILNNLFSLLKVSKIEFNKTFFELNNKIKYFSIPKRSAHTTISRGPMARKKKSREQYAESRTNVYFFYKINHLTLPQYFKSIEFFYNMFNKTLFFNILKYTYVISLLSFFTAITSFINSILLIFSILRYKKFYDTTILQYKVQFNRTYNIDYYFFYYLN